VRAFRPGPSERAMDRVSIEGASVATVLARADARKRDIMGG
jgi:hypothetical protein